MSFADILLNKYSAGIYMLGMSLLMYWELRMPWGIIMPLLGVCASAVALISVRNEGMIYVVIYGGYGFLLSISEWMKRRTSR